MAITNINPTQNSVLNPTDSFSFELDETYTQLVVKIGAAGGDEYAYDYSLGGSQTGYTVTLTDLGATNRVTVSRDAGWDKEPLQVTVVENETGSSATTQFSYYLTSTKVYPEGMQPYADAYEGSLIVTEEDVQVRGDVGWIDFEGDDFDLTDLGNGKVKVNANASLKGGGGGGPSGLEVGNIGKWTVANVAGGGTPAAGEVILISSDNTATNGTILISTTTADGQNYNEWLQRFDSLSEGLTVTVFNSDGTMWFSSPVSSMSAPGGTYRSFTLNHADYANSGAGTWAVSDDCFIEVLPSYPDVSALAEPSKYGLGRMSASTATTETNPNTGFFQFNNANPQLATKIWIGRYCAQGADLQNLLLLGDGNEWTFHAKDNAYGMVQGVISNAILKENGIYDWYECNWEPVAGATALENNHFYGLDIVRDGFGQGEARNGFVDMDDVTVSINEGTRTLNLTGTYTFYADGVRFTVTDDSATWTDTYSLFYFYYDNTGTIQVTGAVTEDELAKNCMIGVLYWHQVNDDAVGGFHNMMKHPDTPSRKYADELWDGAKMRVTLNGLPNGSYTVDGNGSLDSHCEVPFSSAQAILGGTRHYAASRLSTAAIPKIGRIGSGGIFYEEWDAGTAGLVATTGTGRAAYNNQGDVEAANNSYVWAHAVVATGPNYDEAVYLIVMGNNDYTTKWDAENSLATELQWLQDTPGNQQAGLQMCLAPCMSFLVQTSDSYTNSYKSRIVSTSWGANRVNTHLSDTRTSDSAGVSFSTDNYPTQKVSYALNHRYDPYSSASAPGVGDDLEDGHFPGRIWLDTTLNDAYICLDASIGAAVWKIIAT